MLQEGQKAPDFTLPDQNNQKHSLSDYRGEWVLLYFYPKDDTPGCTKEACGIQGSLSLFNQAKSQVLGVSVDSIKSHKKFAEKYGLTFPLLADESKQVVREYDVWKNKKFMGKEYQGIVRSSFLINPEGKIAKIYQQVRPEIHAQEVLTDLIMNR
ncbi:thioredoxin-dependent thiol peroxidase [Patescibacteria group bacterium]|nr:thioredoxin-dependent thiol peroxidase [Patescibacteria group bacterium]